MKLTFEKWEDGRWFVVLPDYDGDQEDLEMVDGADKLLDVLTTDNLYVNLRISKEEDPDMYHHGRFDGEVWLCNVVHYLFGEHPEEIWFEPIQ